MTGRRSSAPASAGPAQDFLVKGGAIKLIGRQADVKASTELTRLSQVLDVVVGKPEAQALLHEMGFVQILGEAEDASHEVATDFDGRLTHTTQEPRRFINNQETKPRILTQKQCGRGGTGERAANNHHIVGGRVVSHG